MLTAEVGRTSPYTAPVAHVLVVGGGVGGLGTALALSRSGHEVTVIERDDTPPPDDADAAFDWNRRGAPQVRHSHAFLARLRNLLRDRHPDVLAALLDAGATELDFIDMLPQGMDRTRRPGDEDLVALACRRTTFEWVLRRVVTDEGSVAIGLGVAATGLQREDATSDPPRITGVTLADGTELSADLVVVAGGRRDGLPRLLAGVGVDLAETIEDTGIVYFSRFFRLRPGYDYPPQNGPIGGDLGYLKYGVFPGDNRTFSITLASGTADPEMRAFLLDPGGFLAAAAALPATAAHVDGRAEPITGVEVMAKLLNRRRRFTDRNGELVVRGLVAVGDSHTCTNPLYGRGCSLAVVQAHLLADSLDEHADVSDAAAAYEAACDTEVLPWYRAAVAQDAATRSAAGDHTAADAPPPDGAGTERESMQRLIREGLLPAMRVDPVVLRAFLRMFNLLEPPDSLLSDWDVVGRIMASYHERDDRPPEPSLGPDRLALLATRPG